MDPHGPYQPPASFQSHFTDKSIGKRSAKRLWRQMVDNPSSLNAEDRELLVDLYDAEIRYTDAMIGEFIDGLADRGLLSDALVIVAADHGEAFGQHDVYGHPRHPYEELIHVPLFVLGGGYPADQRVDQPVENLDIGPTILNCSGCSVPPTFSGEALPRESSEYTDVAPVGIAECRGENDARDTRRVAARSARYNYRIELDDEDHVQTSGLYDRQSDDPKRDVSDDAPDVRAHFDDQIREHNDSIQNARVTAGEEIESELSHNGFVTWATSESRRMTGSSAERPRILQVNKFYSPHIGGVEQTVKATAEGLFEHGYDVRVLAAQSQGRGQEDRVNGISVCRTTSLGTFRSVPLAPTFPVRFRQEATVADLIHHHVPNPIGVISHLLAAPRDVPTVVTYHSDIVRQALELKLYAPLLHTFLDRVDCIFATSPNMIGNSEFLKQYEHKCRVVPLSIETSKFGQYEGASYDLPGKPGKRVLFVGRLNYYKGTEYLIDAMRDIDATLLIIGDGERRDELEARVRDHGLTDRVTFLGHVSEESSTTVTTRLTSSPSRRLKQVKRSESYSWRRWRTGCRSSIRVFRQACRGSARTAKRE